jgi:hypothetical protein
MIPGESHYLLSVYRLHGVILTSIISLTDLSTALWLFVVVTAKCFVGPESPTVHHSFLRFTLRLTSTRLLEFLIRQVSKKSDQMDPRMSFKQLVDDTLIEAWERYHGSMTDLPTTGMEDWGFNQGFYCGLSQEAKEHIDALAGGTFFMLNTEKAQALLEKLSARERASEEYGLKEDSRTAEIDPLTRKLWNRLSGPTLPTVPCILGPFKVHHALCDWGASMNILPKMVYGYLDEDPLVPTPHQLRLVDSVMMQPYGIAKDVLIEFQNSLTLIDFMVMDMDPH